MSNGELGVGKAADWQTALDRALSELSDGAGADVAFLFAHSSFAPSFDALIAATWERLAPRHLVGCAGEALIATRREIEHEPAVVLMTVRTPGATLTPVRFAAGRAAAPAELPASAGTWLLFGDPYSCDGEGLLALLGTRYPGVPVVGGMASSNEGPTHTAVFLDGQVYGDGAVGIAVAGGSGLRPVVSQGCMPIGRPLIVTGAHENMIETIASRPAVDVLVETLRELDEETRTRAQANLLVGMAMDEYREQHGIGDFLIRNLLGYERESGALAVSAIPRVGQTVQFQFRDAAAADQHLRQQLEAARQAFDEEQPVAALLCSCNGRGSRLFGPIDHDPTVLAEALGEMPVAGLFCAGEIGPVGDRNYLHGFTATIVLFTEAGAP
jgi:small ligand-binding sensory domain FIST